MDLRALLARGVPGYPRCRCADRSRLARQRRERTLRGVGAVGDGRDPRVDRLRALISWRVLRCPDPGQRARWKSGTSSTFLSEGRGSALGRRNEQGPVGAVARGHHHLGGYRRSAQSDAARDHGPTRGQRLGNPGPHRVGLRGSGAAWSKPGAPPDVWSPIANDMSGMDTRIRAATFDFLDHALSSNST